MNEVFSVLLVCVAAQGPFFPPNSAFGPYGPPSNPAYGPPAAAASKASPPTIAPSPSIFALNQAIAGVRSEIHMDEGNSVFGDLAPAPFSSINALQKQQGQEIKLQGQYAAERHLVRTTNATQDNLDKMDDLQLSEAATEAQVQRRGAQALPAPYSSLAKVFDSKSHYASLTLAQNQLYDAQQAYAKDPSQKNWVAVQGARDSITANKQSIAGDRADFLGAVGGAAFKPLAIIGPLDRRASSTTALKAEKRNHRQLVQSFLQSPNENNWWALRLSNVKIQALKADLQAERGEVASVPFLGSLGLAAGVAVEDVEFQNEENNWKRYNQLQLANLLRQRAESAYQAQAAAGANPVAQRMLTLSSYGGQSYGAPAPRVLPPPPFGYGRPGR